MKKRIIKCVIGVFVLSLVASFVLFVTFLSIFSEFGLITYKTVVNKAGIVSFLFAIVASIYTGSRIKSERATRFGNWLSNNTAKLCLYYVIANIFFISIRSEVVWTQEEIKNLVSLEWTIFGISIAIFLVWNVLVVGKLRDSKPQKPTELSSLSTLKYISEKGSFYGNVTMLFMTVSMLTCNLVLLTLATTFVYMGSNDLMILKQAVVTLTLYFSTNTILELFMDIVKPLNEEKKAWLQETKVTNTDVETQNRIIEKSNKTFIAIDEVAQLPHLSEEEKQRITMELLRDFLNEDNVDKMETNKKVGVE